MNQWRPTWNIRAFKWFRRAADPTVAAILWAVAFAGVVAACLTLPFDYSLTEMLPAMGGVVVLLGSYFAARTLRDGEVAKALELLNGNTPAVRVAAVHRLAIIAMRTPKYRSNIVLTLRAFAAGSDSDDEDARRIGLLALEQLEPLGEDSMGRMSLRLGDLSVEELFPETKGGQANEA